MNRTFPNKLAKCIDEDQANWSVKLSYVLLDYRSSVHESTAFTLHHLILGHEIVVHLDLMYRPPPSTTPIDVHDCVLQKKKPSARLMSLFDGMLLFSNAVATVCTTNVHTVPHTKKTNAFYITAPLFQSEKVQNFPVRGATLTKFNVNYQVKEVSTGKVHVVHCDRMKRYHGSKPVASNFQTRPTTHITGY